jgi:hypothetical protein
MTSQHAHARRHIHRLPPVISLPSNVDASKQPTKPLKIGPELEAEVRAPVQASNPALRIAFWQALSPWQLASKDMERLLMQLDCQEFLRGEAIWPQVGALSWPWIMLVTAQHAYSAIFAGLAAGKGCWRVNWVRLGLHWCRAWDIYLQNKSYI